MEPWRKRVLLGAAALGILACLSAVGGITWADTMIFREYAGWRRIDAVITKATLVRRSGSVMSRGPRFGKYSLDVRYRLPNGSFEEDSVEKTTYGYPSAGGHVTLLLNPRNGHLETNPFPEVWIVSAIAGAVMIGLIVVFVKFAVFAYRPPGRRRTVR